MYWVKGRDVFGAFIELGKVYDIGDRPMRMLEQVRDTGPVTGKV